MDYSTSQSFDTVAIVFGGQAESKMSRGEARLQRLHRIVRSLRKGPITKNDVCAMVHCSPSGARKYLNEIVAAGVVYVTCADHMSCRVYSLVDDEAVIEAFLSQRPKVPKRSSYTGESALAKAMRNGDRRFHLLQDDSFYLPRLRRTPVAPDPLALPRAFFASAKVTVTETEGVEA